MASENPPKRDKELTGLIWETEVTWEEDGRIFLKPIKPVYELSLQRAAQVIGCTLKTVKGLLQDGHLTGRDNGRPAKQSYGRTILPRTRIDSASVVEYCQHLQGAGKGREGTHGDGFPA